MSNLSLKPRATKTTPKVSKHSPEAKLKIFGDRFVTTSNSFPHKDLRPSKVLDLSLYTVKWSHLNNEMP
jgi:hypothetical protein